MVRPPRLTSPLTLAIAALALLGPGAADSGGQEVGDLLPQRNGHPLLRADLPPGALGARHRSSGGPVQGYYQPVAIVPPAGAEIALAQTGGFDQPVPGPRQAALLVGVAYRFQVTSIPNRPGIELFPTVEIIDRMHPPAGQATRFPIPVHLDPEDIRLALEGRLVTRVIYLEDPQTALPLADEPGTQRTLDVRSDVDPYMEADRLGRPVAILRIGSRVPPTQPGQLEPFLLGNPPWLPIETPAPAEPRSEP